MTGKRLAAILLALALTLTAAGAMAAGPTVSTNAGHEDDWEFDSSRNVLTIKDDGPYTISDWNGGEELPTEGRIVIDSQVKGSVLLRFDDVRLTSNKGSVISYKGEEEPSLTRLYLNFDGNSSLESTYTGGQRRFCQSAGRRHDRSIQLRTPGPHLIPGRGDQRQERRHYIRR